MNRRALLQFAAASPLALLRLPSTTPEITEYDGPHRAAEQAWAALFQAILQKEIFRTVEPHFLIRDKLFLTINSKSHGLELISHPINTNLSLHYCAKEQEKHGDWICLKDYQFMKLKKGIS